MDLSVVKYLCDRIGVMYHGKLVEIAPTQVLFSEPQHPYTKALLSAMPIPNPRMERARKLQIFDDEQFKLGDELIEVTPEHWVLKGEKL